MRQTGGESGCNCCLQQSCPVPPSPILSSGRCHWGRFGQSKTDLKNEAGLLTVSKEMISELIPGSGVNKGEGPDPEEKIVVY